jgi:hypothetical protein
MRNLPRSATVALLLLSLPSLFAAATPPPAIHGLVTGAATGKNIPPVEVIVLWTQRATITNNYGSFTISNVAAGPMQVAAKRTGYQSQMQHVTVPDTGVVTVNFALEPSAKRN